MPRTKDISDQGLRQPLADLIKQVTAFRKKERMLEKRVYNAELSSSERITAIRELSEVYLNNSKWPLREAFLINVIEDLRDEVDVSEFYRQLIDFYMEPDQMGRKPARAGEKMAEWINYLRTDSKTVLKEDARKHRLKEAWDCAVKHEFKRYALVMLEELFAFRIPEKELYAAWRTTLHLMRNKSYDRGKKRCFDLLCDFVGDVPVKSAYFQFAPKRIAPVTLTAFSKNEHQLGNDCVGVLLMIWERGKDQLYLSGVSWIYRALKHPESPTRTKQVVDDVQGRLIALIEQKLSEGRLRIEYVNQLSKIYEELDRSEDAARIAKLRKKARGYKSLQNRLNRLSREFVNAYRDERYAQMQEAYHEMDRLLGGEQSLMPKFYAFHFLMACYKASQGLMDECQYLLDKMPDDPTYEFEDSFVRGILTELLIKAYRGARNQQNNEALEEYFFDRCLQLLAGEGERGQYLGHYLSTEKWFRNGRKGKPPVPFYTVKKLAKATIAVDGNMEEAFYESVEPLSDFLLSHNNNVAKEKAPPELKTEVWMAYDERYFYVTMKARETALDEIKAEVTERDGTHLPLDDSIDVYLAGKRDLTPYQQWGANLNGAIMDLCYTGATIDTSGKVSGTGTNVWGHTTDVEAAGKKILDGWVIEMRISLADIKALDKTEVSGAWVRANIRRMRYHQPERLYWTWAQNDGVFHSAEFFNLLKFE